MSCAACVIPYCEARKTTKYSITDSKKKKIKISYGFIYPVVN